MTLSGTQNMSLHKVEYRPGIPASSCAELRPNSTHIYSQHPRCATKAPAVHVTAARHLTPWRCSCTPRCASAGCWLLLVWLRPQTFTAVGFPLGVFHPRAEQLRCHRARPDPPGARTPTVPPAAPARGGSGQGAETAAPLPRPLCPARWARRCESIGTSEKSLLAGDTPHDQTRTLCNPHEARWGGHPCLVTSARRTHGGLWLEE